MEKITKLIQDIMIDNGLTISTAESCTCGRLATLLTSNDGASKYFIGSLGCYQNHVKTKFLNVKEETINQYDVVSSEVAIEMVNGCCELFNTDCAISVTGYASKSNNPTIADGTIYSSFKVKDNILTKKYELKENRLENLKNVSEMIIADFYDFLQKYMV